MINRNELTSAEEGYCRNEAAAPKRRCWPDASCKAGKTTPASVGGPFASPSRRPVDGSTSTDSTSLLAARSKATGPPSDGSRWRDAIST